MGSDLIIIIVLMAIVVIQALALFWLSEVVNKRIIKVFNEVRKLSNENLG